MKRKILFITTDQQRYDTLSCNGSQVSMTPTLDSFAKEGIRYERAIPQSVVCMPSRSTILTGQHPSTHGVWMNGVPLPTDAPSVAEVLHQNGYRTALIGKAHFEPYIDPFNRFYENALSQLPEDSHRQLHRGFEHLEFATHGAMGNLHYAKWLKENHPEAIGGFYNTLNMSLEVNSEGGGNFGGPQVKINPIDKEWYHTYWVADRTVEWLKTLKDDENWFCWMSFPDPHHPWDPPQSEIDRIDIKNVPLPAGYIGNATERERVLDSKPRHWSYWYTGKLVTNYEAPPHWIPSSLTTDQLKEITALNAVEVELIDDAVKKVWKYLEQRGISDDIDVIFTTDHGELGGDFGLLFKGPYHVDSLMRLPLIWKPAKSMNITPAVIRQPVGLIDLAPTFCSIANIESPNWMQGQKLPINESDRLAGPQLTQWDSELFGVAVHLRTITKNNMVLTIYLPGTLHDGTEGELYDLSSDPLQHVNLFDDPGYLSVKNELIDELVKISPPVKTPRLELEAPV